MKKLRVLITNGALIALGVFMFIFMSQPYFAFKTFGSTETVSGYDYLKDVTSDKLSDNQKLIAVSVLFMVILASLLILVALLNLLVNFNIIKSKSASKILNVVNTIVALVMVVFAICAISGAAQIAKNTSTSIGSVDLTEGNAGWGVILNLILAVAALFVAIVELLLSIKKKKGKK